MSHKAGFVSIIGKPNAGKSTLMNALVGEKMSIITPKAQTTRHRILGIVNDEDYQIVFSDTPGIIKPHYALHESMMHQVEGSIVDADLILLVTDIKEEYDEQDVLKKLEKSDAPLAVLINKIDLSNEEEVRAKAAYWQEKLNPKAVFAVSALHDHNIKGIFDFVLENLPEHPPYYEKDALTDRNDRFFASEMIRAQVFKQYKKEIPYSTEVIVTAFKEDPKIYRISAEIIVERESQKNIIIGNKGEMLKIVGTYARRDMEEFFQRKIFLEMFVKVIPDWRSKKNYLKKFGYE
ncbi:MULTISPECIES: GTPase Era [unclassified Mucilaginibacter]|uniref:GTPase Era n=1 Tax=unclassified Mucilaginibacter TaxID=2617802 RepID=UPI000967C22E|nr:MULTISPECIES: GTPase Era [unclassified Mucilaginibacter]OJW17483.1 MAG: GTPase Era [Mucilaginibacter sp. 44-25]PAW92836.1 GTPase Era [Mucilaginibacter sp. MD40]PLW88954.1 MAG: GTPase Era [Mucilaginibacter sp.]HEK19864.1 GTPase Era [Bacteroidota bacterium]